VEPRFRSAGIRPLAVLSIGLPPTSVQIESPDITVLRRNVLGEGREVHKRKDNLHTPGSVRVLILVQRAVVRVANLDAYRIPLGISIVVRRTIQNRADGVELEIEIVLQRIRIRRREDFHRVVATDRVVTIAVLIPDVGVLTLECDIETLFVPEEFGDRLPLYSFGPPGEDEVLSLRKTPSGLENSPKLDRKNVFRFPCLQAPDTARPGKRQSVRQPASS